MRKHCSNVCNLCLYLDKESNNSARKRTIVAAALQRQYSQTELTFWITYVLLASTKQCCLLSIKIMPKLH
jgi:hypothetical protein